MDVQAVCCVLSAQVGRGEGEPSQVGQMEYRAFTSSAGPALHLKLGREAEESGASQTPTSYKVAMSPGGCVTPWGRGLLFEWC